MIKLMTYNIRTGFGMDDIVSLHRVIDVIRDVQAEIVCIQETDQVTSRSLWADQPAVMARALDMNHSFQGNIEYYGGWYGIAILSKYDIIEENRHYLTSVGEPRGMLHTKIQTPNGLLSVFCTHFGLDEDERATQGKEASKIINAVSGAKVVCGDFNEEVDAEGVSHLIKAAGLIDSDPNANLTFDAADPSVRIDLMLHSPEITIHSINTIQSMASDHLPLVADIFF